MISLKPIKNRPALIGRFLCQFHKNNQNIPLFLRILNEWGFTTPEPGTPYPQNNELSCDLSVRTDPALPYSGHNNHVRFWAEWNRTDSFCCDHGDFLWDKALTSFNAEVGYDESFYADVTLTLKLEYPRHKGLITLANASDSWLNDLAIITEDDRGLFFSFNDSFDDVLAHQGCPQWVRDSFYRCAPPRN